MITVALILFAATLVVGVPTAIAHYRYRSFIRTSAAHQVLVDAHASWVVDRALKALVQACEREPRRVPGVVMVTLDAETVTVHISAPSPHPPAPWSNTSSGLIWRASLRELQHSDVDPATANPYTGLVTIGVGDEGRVFADLDQAHGLISIGGDEHSRREIARRWIEEAPARPWAAGGLSLVGLDAGASPAATPGTTVDDVVAIVRSGAPGLALIEGAPGDDAVARLVTALEAETSRCPVILLGHSAHARWRFTAHQNGWVTSDFLPSARFTPDAAELDPAQSAFSPSSFAPSTPTPGAA